MTQPPGPIGPPPASGGYPQPPGLTYDPGPFYLSHLGQEQGPYDFGQLAAMAAAGQLRGDSLLRRADGPTWFPAKQVPGLFSRREWLVTLLLGILLGSFAVDRFYLGYVGLGIAKLVVSLLTCFVGGLIWQIVDVVLVLMRKLPDVDGRPLA